VLCVSRHEGLTTTVLVIINKLISDGSVTSADFSPIPRASLYRSLSTSTANPLRIL